MDVEKYAPFTSSPLDASRGRGRRFMLPRLRSSAVTNPIRRTTSTNESTPTVVVILTPPSTSTASIQQTTSSQVGGVSNGKFTNK
jgi:hypothetical protein